jgi:hypothetical protein
MDISVYLNNTLLQDEPKGIEGIEEVIKRDDEELGGVFISYESDLEFWGDGYRFIYNEFKQNGFCRFINIRIVDNTNNRELKGIIRVTACEFDLQRAVVKCPIDDDNFGAYIFNNKNIKAKLDVGKSKNGVNIAPAPIKSWTLFNPQAQTTSSNRYGITYYDAMSFLVSFMSDGNIGFRSNFLQFGSNNLNWGSQLVLMRGLEVRTYINTTDSIVTISFQDAFDNLRSLFPVLFGIEIDSNGQVFLRIEEESYFASNQNALVVDYQDDLILSFDTFKLYSNLKLGSGKVANYNASASPQIHSFPPLRFLQFQQEEYQLQGTCNIDKMKDLSLTYITDHNIIEELVETNTSNSAYDNDVFIVQCVSDNIREAVVNQLQGINAWLYNVGISNRSVIERFGFAGNIAFYQSNVDATFMAEKPLDSTFYAVSRFAANTQPNEGLYATFSGFPPVANFLQIIPYPNEIFDTSNTYNNILYEFIAPATGFYTFNVEQEFQMSLNARYTGLNLSGQADTLPALVKNTLCLAVLSNLNVLQFEFINTRIYDNNVIGEDIKTQNINQSMYLTTGQKAIVYVRAFIRCANQVLQNVNNNNTGYEEDVMSIRAGVFKCTASLTGGGVYKPSDAQNYFTANLKFTNKTTQNEWDSLKFGIAKSIFVNRDGQNNYVSWVNEIRRNWITTATDYTTITNTDNIL